MEMNDELRKDAEAELRKDAEIGRKAKIAAEVLNEILDDRREILVCTLESGDRTMEEILSMVAMLRMMNVLRTSLETRIQRGEIAEEELRNGE